MARKWNEKMRRWLTGLNDDASARAADFLSELSNKINYDEAREIVRSALVGIEMAPAIGWFALALASDVRVPVADKLRVGLVAAYLAAPYNQALAAVLGPLALVDDMVLVVVILFLIANMMQRVDEEVLLDNWVGERSHGEQVVEICRTFGKVVGIGDVARQVDSAIIRP